MRSLRCDSCVANWKSSGTVGRGGEPLGECVDDRERDAKFVGGVMIRSPPCCCSRSCECSGLRWAVRGREMGSLELWCAIGVRRPDWSEERALASSGEISV